MSKLIQKSGAILVLATLLVGCGEAPEVVVIPQKIAVVAAEKAQYLQEYTTNGEIQAEQTTEVATRFGGVVDVLFVKEGDYVEADDLLLRYSTGGAENEAALALDRAQNSLTSAREIYSAMASASTASRFASDKALQIAKNDLESGKKELEMAVRQATDALAKTTQSVAETKLMAEKGLRLAEQSLALAQLGYDTAAQSLSDTQSQSSLNTTHAIEAAKKTPANVWASIQSGISLADEILGASPQKQDANNSYEQALKAYDPQFFNETTTLLLKVIKLQNSRDWFGEKNVDSQFLSDMDDLAVNTSEVLSKIDQIFTRTSPDSSFTSTQKTLLTSSVQSSIAALSAAHQSLQGAKQTLESTNLGGDISLTRAQEGLRNAETALSQAKIMFEQAKNQQNQINANADLSLLQAKNALEQAQLARSTNLPKLELALASTQAQRQMGYAQQDSSVANAKNGLNEAESALESVMNKYFDQIEKAPVSGYITKFEVKVGDSLGQGMKLAEIVQLNDLRISYNVPLDVATDLHEGTLGRVICGDGTAVSAKVNLVGVTANSSHMVNSEAKLDATQSQACKAGELTEVTLAIVRPARVQVPVSALTWRNSKAIVWVVGTDNIVKARTVEFRQVAGESAVLDGGLEAGEMVVLQPNSELTEGVQIETTRDKFQPSILEAKLDGKWFDPEKQAVKAEFAVGKTFYPERAAFFGYQLLDDSIVFGLEDEDYALEEDFSGLKKGLSTEKIKGGRPNISTIQVI